MKHTLRGKSRTRGRRGVTLVEMLVTLAVLLLMMTVIVQIFAAATGSLNSAQVYQQLDGQLRALDVMIRSDLNGVTAKMTPPNDPKNNTGYFEYGENEFADIQGEDGDDYIRFTAKAPPGRPFTGRIWVGPQNAANLTGQQAQALWAAGFQPITITSEFAEIIYFLRNGNLYRRVFLVAPELQSSLVPAVNNTATVTSGGGPFSISYTPATLNGIRTSWQGVNDLSARPASSGAPYHNNSVVLNTLGDLTNRHNRAFYQRFANDFQQIDGSLVSGGDGLIDDRNGDNVPDYYPTLYPGVFLHAAGTADQRVFEPNYPAPRQPAALAMMAFPFVYPGAYSAPQTLSTGTAPVGWIHSPNPLAFDPATNASVAFDANPLRYLNLINHNPLDIGDNVALPGTATLNRGTWWGFPNWRETLSPGWQDPTVQVNVSSPPAQPRGLVTRFADVVPVVDDANLLPPMLLPSTFSQDFSVFRQNQDGFSDGLGVDSIFWGGNTVNQAALWSVSWEDDLIMTGVRSFDIKAFDVARSDYVDLGWGDDARINSLNNVAPYLASTFPPVITWNFGNFDLLNQSFAHEGRMPPLLLDHRLDASYPNTTYDPSTGSFVPQFFGYPNYSSNIGDDNAAIVRLRRVWDSWSTDYSRAPANGILGNGFPVGPPFSPPMYPSYPAPYPAPLRGIQIQIRVVDPGNQRIKTLTIRQDFTDKL